MRWWLLFLDIAVLTTSVHGLGEDLTLLIRQKGAMVIEAVVDKIRENCIFPGDRLFLTRLAVVQSNNGLNGETYRDDYYGGIWQIDEDKYNLTRTCPGILKQTCDDIQATLNIYWGETAWIDLRKPLYSGLAASLYIMFEENITSNSRKGLSGDKKKQAGIWKKLFAPDRDASDFYNIPSSSYKGTCNRPIDLAFIIDGSGSIGKDDFNKTLQFITEVVNGMDIGPDATQVAVVKFSSYANVEFYVNNYTDTVSLTQAVANIRYTGLGTDTAEALKVTANSVFVHKNGMRSNAAKVAVVVTDGQSNNPTQTIHAAPILKSTGAVVFSIGIGNVNLEELETISSDVDCTHVFILSNFNEIATITSDIQKKACRVHQNLKYNSRITIPLTGNETKINVKIPPHANSSLITNVTCGVVKIYVSYNSSNPNDALYTYSDVALHGNPSVMPLENGKEAIITYAGVMYKEPILRTVGCEQPVFTSSVQANPLGAEIICRTNGIEHKCTMKDFQLSGFGQYFPNGDFGDIMGLCNQNTPDGVEKYVFHNIDSDPTKFVRCDANGNAFVTQCPGGRKWTDSTFSCDTLDRPPLKSTNYLPTVNESRNTNPTDETKDIVATFTTVYRVINTFLYNTIERSEVVCRRYGREVSCTLFDIQISEYSKYLVKDSWNDVPNPCDTSADFRNKANLLKENPLDVRKFIICTKQDGVMYVAQCPKKLHYFPDDFECRPSNRDVSPPKIIVNEVVNLIESTLE